MNLSDTNFFGHLGQHFGGVSLANIAVHIGTIYHQALGVLSPYSRLRNNSESNTDHLPCSSLTFQACSASHDDNSHSRRTSGIRN